MSPLRLRMNATLNHEINFNSVYNNVNAQISNIKFHESAYYQGLPKVILSISRQYALIKYEVSQEDSYSLQQMALQIRQCLTRSQARKQNVRKRTFRFFEWKRKSVAGHWGLIAST